MEPFFDAYLTAPEDSPGGAPPLPEGFSGALLFGPAAKAIREEFRRWHPDRRWVHAERLERIVGESNARFPSRAAQVIDLDMQGEELADWLKRPSEWWPLCETLRGTRRLLRLRLPPGTAAVAKAKQLIRRFPETRFWIDPFVAGPVNGWQGHVRLAEYNSVMLTTLGLFPGEPSSWSEANAREALRFVVGEVGAGTLLFASGMEWGAAGAEEARRRRQWLETSPELDAEARRLVLEENAQARLIPPEQESQVDSD